MDGVAERLMLVPFSFIVGDRGTRGGPHACTQSGRPAVGVSSDVASLACAVRPPATHAPAVSRLVARPAVVIMALP